MCVTCYHSSLTNLRFCSLFRDFRVSETSSAGPTRLDRLHFQVCGSSSAVINTIGLRLLEETYVVHRVTCGTAETRDNRCVTWDAFLCEDQVWFETDDVFADLLDVVFLHLQDPGKILLLTDLYVRLHTWRTHHKHDKQNNSREHVTAVGRVAGMFRTWLSPFLYSREQSSRTIRGFLIMRLMRGWVTSLFSITPLSTHESSIIPPGTWTQTGLNQRSNTGLS